MVKYPGEETVYLPQLFKKEEHKHDQGHIKLFRTPHNSSYSQVSEIEVYSTCRIRLLGRTLSLTKAIVLPFFQQPWYEVRLCLNISFYTNHKTQGISVRQQTRELGEQLEP